MGNWSVRQYTFSYFFIDLEAKPMFYSSGVRVCFLLIYSIKISILYNAAVFHKMRNRKYYFHGATLHNAILQNVTLVIKTTNVQKGIWWCQGHFSLENWQMSLLNQQKCENGHRAFFHDKISTKECGRRHFFSGKLGDYCTFFKGLCKQVSVFRSCLIFVLVFQLWHLPSSWPLEIKCWDRFEFGSTLYAQTKQIYIKRS